MSHTRAQKARREAVVAADQQPWRCVHCETPIRLGMNDPCRCDNAHDLDMEGRRAVADHIRTLVNTFAKHPWDINCGDCDTFSDALLALLGPEAKSHWVSDLADCSEDEGEEIPHAVTFYRGWFFDAEEPYGVRDWRHLPLCARALRKIEDAKKKSTTTT